MSDLMETKYRDNLPQLGRQLFLTDGGMETSLIFHEGWDLPCFETFVLLESEKGREALKAYYKRYLEFALDQKVGFILESPTWRANPEWGEKLGYSSSGLAKINHEAISFMKEIRASFETDLSPMPISGCIGPRGDGYDPGKIMSVEDAKNYHAWQIGQFEQAGADFVSAFTLTNFNEALGFVLAAKELSMPSVVSFTLETDGRLPTGEHLRAAIEQVDEKTNGWPAYYMINCAHPTHFESVLEVNASWMKRISGIRANSSRCSHAELDNASELDTGNPKELGQQYRDLLATYPHINVLGGCCGTDHRHIEEIWHACKEAA